MRFGHEWKNKKIFKVSCMVLATLLLIGADAPLSSYAYITVNGEDWGLYLAVEGVEQAFLRRNYGEDYGELYKPDTDSNEGEGAGAGELNTKE